MGAAELKSKISDKLNRMDSNELKQAWLILKEISNQPITKLNAEDKLSLEANLAKGIQQLDEGKGTDFNAFVGKLKNKYGSR